MDLPDRDVDHQIIPLLGLPRDTFSMESDDSDWSSSDEVPRPAISNAGPSSPQGAETSSSSKLDETAPKQNLARWAGPNFNKPHGTLDDQVPKLMRQSEIQSSRSFELYRIHSALFELSEGDTLVIIDYPMQSGSSKFTDCNGITFKSQTFRVHSDNLLKTGSSKFADLLGPSYQFRVKRRRKLVNQLPADIKYVVDLSPPSEGDELVFQMTELSLTPGIVKWWSSSMLHGVDSCLVSGHDDVCACEKESWKDEDPDKINGLVEALPFDPENILAMKARGQNDLYYTPDYRRIPDYCPIRHRNGLIRLMMLIEGKPTLLDSAPRLWTLVKLSKILDCASVIRDRAAQWIMHGPNSRFIEVLPEEALQIAFDLELPEITQAAFRILVNELALEEASTRGNSAHTTIFGRQKGDIPDELSNLVQHAARGLVERISGILDTLKSREAFDSWSLDEWTQLNGVEQLLAQRPGLAADFALSKLRLLKASMIDAVERLVEQTLLTCSAHSDSAFKSMDQDRATYVEPKDYETLLQIMQVLNPVQKLLCSFTYNELGIALDRPLYGRHPSHSPESKGLSYDKLLKSASAAIQKVVDDNPNLVYSEAWRPCFDDMFPGRFAASRLRRPQNRQPLICFDTFEKEIRTAMQPICWSWIRRDIEPPLNLTRHLLLTLDSSEMKFLPLWAGGCDDGTGGVFESQIPPTDMGPNGPGPSFHTGFSIPSTPSSVCGSMTEDLAEMRLRGSTFSESMNVHDSISTIYRPGQVIADDVSIVSDTFTAGASEYQDARFQVPVDGQAMAMAVEMLVDEDDLQGQATSDERDEVESRTEPADDSDVTDFWNESDSDDDSVITIDADHLGN